MTNHWNDIDNASLIIVDGANPAENHPACFAHINAARFGSKKAQLIVVDPRKTRTAMLADKFVRIRPGTNIAFTNGVLRYIMNNISGTAATNHKAWLNGTAGASMALRNFCDDAGATVAVSWPKYTDARVLVDTEAGHKDDYVRENKLIDLPGTGGYTTTGALAGAQRPTVIEDDGAWKMWYLNGPGFVKMSTSVNGVAFSAAGDTDVASSLDAPLDAPHVFKDSGKYYMLNNDGDNITVRSSTNGTTWSAPTIIFAKGFLSGTAPSIFTAQHLDNPCILKDGTTWRLYFQGHNTATGNETLYWIFSASTTVAPALWGPTSFGTASAVVKPTAGAWDAFRVMQPSVWKDGSEYFMWYVGYNSPTATLQTGWARSADGVAWTKQGTVPVLGAAGSAASKPVVIKTATQFIVYYGGTTGIMRAVNTLSTKKITDLPALAASIDVEDSVYHVLKGHVDPYTTSVVADICGCTAADISYVGDAIIANSRCSSSDFGQAASTPTVATYKATTILYAMGQTQYANASQNIKDLAVLQSLMGNMGRAGGGINALRGIHNVQGSTDMGNLFDAIPGYSDNPGKGDVAESYEHYSNKLFGNRLTGAGAKNPYLPGHLGLQQRGFYNMTREWFGDTTGDLRTIDNEKIKMLGTSAIALTHTNVALVAVKDAENGTEIASTAYTVDPIKGTITRTGLAGIADQQDVYVTYTINWAYSTDDFKALWGLWPKDDGYDHITAFREMQQPGGSIKACYVIGQNPAVTEPNQSEVRDGLENLDLLVVQDMFATETAQCKRKSTGVTYLLPACSHVEEAGSVTNSGRWLQWREKATKTKGSSKADIELLLRLAKALDVANGFSHIPLMPNTSTGSVKWANAYDMLWRKYTTFVAPPTTGTVQTPAAWTAGWVPGGAGTFDALSESPIGNPGTLAISRAAGEITSTVPRTGSELVCERVFKEMCSSAATGTMWIYANAYNKTGYSERPTTLSGAAVTNEAVKLTGVAVSELAHFDVSDGTVVVKSADGATTYINGSDYTVKVTTGEIKRVDTGRIASSSTLPHLLVSYKYNVGWTEVNRARSRNNTFPGDANGYPRWGWAWLYNRRVFYNNGEVPNDEADNFVTPHLMAGLFTLKSTSTHLTGDFGLTYRAFKTFKDIPTHDGAIPAIHGGYAGRFPAHTEPYESPRDGTNPALGTDLVSVWGRNSTTGLTENLVKVEGDQGGKTLRGTAVGYPLVLTTIRCVEHFQGGPTTRNNSWNVEAEPVPWIEINSIDARNASPQINDGDWVNVTTARSNSTDEQEGRTGPKATAGWAMGFKARVGVGLQSNQRVAQGVVAIPWHWGDQGLSTGSRANDLCIDAWDANTKIPEYKACLCKIKKML